MVREGFVTMNGRPVRRPSETVNPGDTVAATLPAQHEDGMKVLNVPVLVLYEDRHLLVVDKPAGMTVHPGPGHAGDTLVNALLATHAEMASVGQPDRPGVVHRLDRDTSGLLVFALSGAAYDGLTDAIRSRQVKRTYTALVAGRVEPPEGVIDAPIGRDPSNRTRQAITPDGKAARTRYRVDRHLKGATLLEVTLETGRMHQIRVHMAGIGHPVIGDPTYSRSGAAAGLTRQFLHASRLSFTHPVTGNTVDISSPLPEDLRRTLEAYG
jgi:23S rRNA pseudouridine1911/1915/1917 synthase